MNFFAVIAVSLLFLSISNASLEEETLLREAFQEKGVESLKNESLHTDTQNDELVELGRLLFFDKVLSGNRNISCSTCHFPSMGTSDELPVPIGEGGQGIGLQRKLSEGKFIPRNAPAIFNMGFKSFHTSMWDERISVDYKKDRVIVDSPEPSLNGPSPENKNFVEQVTSLAAAQSLFPVTSRHEMRGDEGENEIADAETNSEIWKRLTQRVVGSNNGTTGGIEEYRRLLKAAYPKVRSYDEFHFAHLARAIGAFEMWAFQAANSPFDDFLDGDRKALSRKQIRGAKVFVDKGRCLACHSGSHLTNFKSYSTGMAQLGPGKTEPYSEKGEDYGLELMSGLKKDRYKFKTPTLRNVYHTGPWSHSGAYDDLESFLYHHVSPKQAMQDFIKNPSDYVTVKSYEDFEALADRDLFRNQARLRWTDPIFETIELNQKERADLYEFLKSLSDLSFYNRVNVPKTVPSGLTVDH